MQIKRHLSAPARWHFNVLFCHSYIVLISMTPTEGAIELCALNVSH